MMMFIPLPLLIASKLPLKQKIAVCTIFFMGTFVIIAAILTKVPLPPLPPPVPY